MIPLVNLPAQHHPLEEQLADAVARVMASGRYVGGDEVSSFEREFAAFCGAKYCVACASGTDAIELIARAHGSPWTMIPANTFRGTQDGLERAGSRVTHCDVDLETGLVSGETLADAVGCAMPVSLYGSAAPPGGDWLDACQAHGEERHGRTAAYSFYPTKPLGCMGDGGAVVTDDADAAALMRELRNHGWNGTRHVRSGTNSRLDAMQAAILRVKLPHVREWNQARRRVADWYHAALADVPGVVRPEPPYGAMHLYVVRVAASERDRVRRELAAVGVDTGIHYAEPLAPEHVAPNAWQRAREMISLPMWAEMTEGMVAMVARELGRAVRG